MKNELHQFQVNRIFAIFISVNQQPQVDFNIYGKLHMWNDKWLIPFLMNISMFLFISHVYCSVFSSARPFEIQFLYAESHFLCSFHFVHGLCWLYTVHVSHGNKCKIHQPKTIPYPKHLHAPFSIHFSIHTYCIYADNFAQGQAMSMSDVGLFLVLS